MDKEQDDEANQREAHERKTGKRFEGLLPETLKKAISLGAGALLLTEESVKNVVQDLKLPKETLGFLYTQAEKTRKEVFSAMTQEFKKYLYSKEMERLGMALLQRLSVQIKAEITFKVNEQGALKLSVKTEQAEVKTNTNVTSTPQED